MRVTKKSSEIESALDFSVIEGIPEEPKKEEPRKEEPVKPQVKKAEPKKAKPAVKKEKKAEVNKKLSSDSIKTEIAREKYKKKYERAVKSTVMTLAVVAAVAILLANTWLPVMQIYSTSMEPTLAEDEIVVAIKGSDFETGDVVSLWYGSKLMIKRVIAGPGQWVDITSDGTVSVDGTVINEPYVHDSALGSCNIRLPYQVPEDKYFVMGDHRSTSQDSRNSSFGCIPTEQFVGRVCLRIWPFNKIGRVNK